MAEAISFVNSIGGTRFVVSILLQRVGGMILLPPGFKRSGSWRYRPHGGAYPAHPDDAAAVQYSAATSVFTAGQSLMGQMEVRAPVNRLTTAMTTSIPAAT